jgi:hypothetical protein
MDSIYPFRIKTKEAFVHTFRIVTALLLIVFWAPKGNTGESSMPPIKPILVRKELQKYFSK